MAKKKKSNFREQMQLFPEMKCEKSAVFSPCRKYRYTLWRRWAEGPYVAFICLNPSTADHEIDDPTVRRIIDYSKRWKFSAVCVLNLFAYRSTDPQLMKKAADPIGLENDLHIRKVIEKADLVVVAWSNHGVYKDRASQVLSYLKKPHFLELSKSGQPKHPLYLKKSLKPKLWRI